MLEVFPLLLQSWNYASALPSSFFRPCVVLSRTVRSREMASVQLQDLSEVLSGFPCLSFLRPATYPEFLATALIDLVRDFSAIQLQLQSYTMALAAVVLPAALCCTVAVLLVLVVAVVILAVLPSVRQGSVQLANLKSLVRLHQYWKMQLP